MSNRLPSTSFASTPPVPRRRLRPRARAPGGRLLLSAFLTSAFCILAAAPAHAQLVGTDTAPGSSCAGFPAGATRMTADADQDGAQVVLICDGTNWIAMAGGGSTAAAPDRAIQFNSGGSFAADGNFVYTSTGRLGFGTSNPAQAFHVYTAATQWPAVFESGINAAQIPIRTTVGDYRLGVGVSGGDNFFIYDETDSATRLLIDGDGNVGIGTASPGYPLVVAGAASIGGVFLNGDGYGSAIDFDASGGITLRKTHFGEVSIGGNDYRQATNPANGLLVAGNVGIGTTAPSYLLSLGGNAVRTIGMDRHTTADTAGNALTLLAGGATSGATNKNGGDLILSGGIATGTGDSNVVIKAYQNGASTDMFTINGNLMSIALGSGTASGARSKSWSLYTIASGDDSTASGGQTVASGLYSMVWGHLSDATGETSTAWGYDTTASGYGATSWGALTTAGPGNYATAFGLEAKATGANTVAIGLGDSSAASAAEYPLVSGAGSFGIFMGDQKNVNITGTNVMALLGGSMIIDPDTTSAANVTPADTLHVVGDVRIAGGTSGSGKSLKLYNGDGNSYFSIQNYAGSGQTGVVFRYDGVVKYAFDTAGNLGIGTTNPNQGKVEVKGGTVCVDTNSDDNASSCIASESDMRLKKNIVDLGPSLDTLMQLRPVSFDWRHDDPEVLEHYPLISRFEDQPHSIGLIAQDVQKLIPEAIDQETVGDEEVQYLQLDYDKLMPVVIKAIQELKGENDMLRARLEELEQE